MSNVIAPAANVPIPAWADIADPWEHVDGAWQRVVRTAGTVGPGTIELAVMQTLHDDGTAEVDPPSFEMPVVGDEIDDVRAALTQIIEWAEATRERF